MPHAKGKPSADDYFPKGPANSSKFYKKIKEDPATAAPPPLRTDGEDPAPEEGKEMTGLPSNDGGRRRRTTRKSKKATRRRRTTRRR